MSLILTEKCVTAAAVRNISDDDDHIINRSSHTMPSPTQPQVSDFPSDLHPVIHLPPKNQLSNVIVFFSGLGDTSSNFAGFAKALNLPDALTITLQPPFPLPFPAGPGGHWSDDIQIDTQTGTIDADSPVIRASKIVADSISDVLIKKHNFTRSQIHLFGYGQGGSVAISVALNNAVLALGPLGSIVSIGGALPISSSHVTKTRSRTPVLLLGGSRGELAKSDQSPVKRLKSLFEFVEYHQWKKADDSMPKSREEVLPMMQFLARVLRSRRGVPDDATEIV